MALRDQLQTTLGGAFTLDRELGGGGMSRVFVATETRLRRSVVVKVMSPELAAGLSAERFEREIQLAASLQQANIVPVLSAGDMDGVPYYTMPFVEGESLRARLAAGPLPVSECVGILRDVARALSYAHAHGVVHRDIKPDNVLLSHGAAVVTDFGIAKAISASRTQPGLGGASALTHVGMAIGTPAYMSPEQVSGDPDIDHRSDIYAFGCMAYELLTGQPPFSGASPQRVLAAHIRDTAAPVRSIRRDTPPALDALVTRCLAKAAEDRPASADEVMQALDAVATSGSGQSVSVPQRTRLGGRHIAYALGALVVIAMLGLWERHRRGAAPSLDRSIAVLPFANLSGDKANDYLGEGLAEELTNALGKGGLRVIGRGVTARALVARGLDASAIGGELHVGSVLQGAVQRVGDRLRVNVSLVASSDGSQIWSETFDENMKDWFAVQDKIARSVANHLQVAVAGGSLATSAHAETSDPEAHALYLQGLAQWNLRTAKTLLQAIALFEKAIQRDPGYARAYAGMAMAYVVLPLYGDFDRDAMTSKALDAARKALVRDSMLVEAHAAIGYAHFVNFDNAESERAFATAIRLDSSFATAHFWRAMLLARIGSFQEAMREAQRARALEPASANIQNGIASLLFDMRRHNEADSVFRAVLALNPGFVGASIMRSGVLGALGRNDEQFAIVSRLEQDSMLSGAIRAGMLARAQARAGRMVDAKATLARVRGDTSIASAVVAQALLLVGEREAAIAMFERAVARHSSDFTWIHNVSWDDLRKEPRLAPLFARIESR